MMLTAIYCTVSFVVGALVSALIFMQLSAKKEREYIELKTKLSSNDNLTEIIKRDFVQLANETIKREQEDLRKQNRESLEEKILPLTKELKEFKEKVEKLNITGVENTAKLVEQLNILDKNNKSIEQEAKNLTEALTKNQNVKGAFGEELLETILQNSGMQEGINYIKQYSTNSENLRDETSHKIRPDIVINLPDNRHLIIDSKVTLTSYLEYTKDNSKLKDFKNEVKKRINDLAEKNYQNASNLYQPDFVLMYMPLDASLSLLYEDEDIVNLAYKSNIIIIGTASLIATIRLVNQLFAQQKQNENVQRIVTAGTNLYETFVKFCNDLINIQKNLDMLSQQFTTAINRFQRANKNSPSLFSQINALKELGLNTNKEIPPVLLEELEELEERKEEITIND